MTTLPLKVSLPAFIAIDSEAFRGGEMCLQIYSENTSRRASPPL